MGSAPGTGGLKDPPSAKGICPCVGKITGGGGGTTIAVCVSSTTGGTTVPDVCVFSTTGVGTPSGSSAIRRSGLDQVSFLVVKVCGLRSVLETPPGIGTD